MSTRSTSAVSLRPVSNLPTSVAAVADAEHLRHVIEKQPSCLLRVSLDGVVLAANDAALTLWGAQDIGQVLGRSLTGWIVAEHRDRWTEFAALLGRNTPGSFDCDVTNVRGERRSMLFHAVPLLNHSDGILSMMLGVRDTSALRVLESRCLQEAQERVSTERDRLEQLLKMGRNHLELQRAQLADAVAERGRLETLLEQSETTKQALAAEYGELQATLVEQHQRELQSRDYEAQQQLAALRAQLTQAIAERQQLDTLLQQREQVLAETKVEAQYLNMMLTQVTPLAAAGRLALEIGGELRSIMEAIDGHASLVLAQSLPNSQCREAAEALRGDALRAAWLTRQFEHARVDASAVNDRAHLEMITESAK
jgi:PAS domain S-box-containing protein